MSIFTGLEHVTGLNMRSNNLQNTCYSPVMPRNPAFEYKALVFYRYISWFLTSAFYMAGPPPATPVFKLGVVLTLLVAGRIAVHLYEQSRQSPGNTLLLVTIETLGIALLLVPTGGLTSPFMWYTLNPIFMATVLPNSLYCWGVLVVFLTAATAGSALYQFQALQVLVLWQEHSWLLLVFLLLTAAAQIFARLIKRLKNAYLKLNRAHQATEHSLRHIANLYQALETFSGGEDPARLAGLLAGYARKLTGSRAGFCFLDNRQGHFQCEISDPDGLLSRATWLEKADMLWRRNQSGKTGMQHLAIEQQGINSQLICAPVQSPSACYGLLGYLAPSDHQAGENGERALTFLAELGAIVLERCQAEELAAKLMVVEEQNRIANEIHDGVSQHLFSIVYALHALGRKQAHLQDSEVQRQIQLIKKTANQAARELRASIYRISPQKRGEQVFVAGISSYLDCLAQLNGIKVSLEAEGSEEALSPALRKALYRIIREATSNSVRHGKCSSIKVILHMAPGKVFLQVTDDGRGFNVNDEIQNGLGLTNMQNLMTSFKGRFTIQSQPGKGTSVTCTVPGEEHEVMAEHPAAGGAEF